MLFYAFQHFNSKNRFILGLMLFMRLSLPHHFWCRYPKMTQFKMIHLFKKIYGVQVECNRICSLRHVAQEMWMNKNILFSFKKNQFICKFQSKKKNKSQNKYRWICLLKYRLWLLWFNELLILISICFDCVIWMFINESRLFQPNISHY